MQKSNGHWHVKAAQLLHMDCTMHYISWNLVSCCKTMLYEKYHL